MDKGDDMRWSHPRPGDIYVWTGAGEVYPKYFYVERVTSEAVNGFYLEGGVCPQKGKSRSRWFLETMPLGLSCWVRVREKS